MRADLAVTTPVIGPDTDGDPLLESKFEIPERPHFMVARPRLLDTLIARRDTPVTLVVGPAGSGKTQLAASWVRGEAAHTAVAWITLEDEDDQVSGFWTYVVAALRRAGVSVSASLTAPPSRAGVDRSFLVRLAAELSEQELPTLLVLDGASSIAGDQWAADLEFVLRHTSPALRLALIGRWDPPLPLHRYRLAGRLTEIRSENLAFTTEEAAELLELHSVHLSPPGLASLLEHTEGWAAGLRLFAMALQDHRDAEHLVDTITGNEATIAEYFVDEVLRVQPPHVRAFLLEASILDTFTPELAAAVTGRADARRLLAELERRNAFVQPAAEYSATYRFHRLFAELLRAQLMCEAPERTADLHGHAAVWLAAHGQTVEAVSHAVKARDWHTAATIAVDHYMIGRLVLEGDTGRLGTLLGQLPDDCDDAEAAVVAAALALADASLDRCARQLARAEDLVIRRGWEYSEALALADSILGLLLAAARGEHHQVLQLSPATEQALAGTPAGVLTKRPELRLLTTAARGFAHSHLGALDAAVPCLAQVAASTVPGCRYLAINCLEHLALLEAYRGRLDHAGKLATEALEAADRCGLEPAHRPVLAHLALAWVAMERYHVDAAGRHLRASDPRHHPRADGVAAAAYGLVKSRRLQARGELRGAMALLEEALTSPGPPPPQWLARELAVSHGHLLIVTGRPQEAFETVGRFAQPHVPEVVVLHAAALAARGEPQPAAEILLPVLASGALTPPTGVEAWLVMATIAEQLGDVEHARSSLRHALRGAAPELQRRAVQQVWARLRRVLRDDDELASQYRALQGDAPAGQRPGARAANPDSLVIVEALSRREMEVLQGMAAMLPTEEIAATLYVSVNTVKTHVRSILRKLSASRRNEAVRRARSLGLIGDVTRPG
ncbi:LuxR C-terminal-related transcriptional regulator [Actinoplanes sp. NPDC051346]|uniref:LuxR C-terminal-related transcriptional regulator n=1 Tax=Actinoplanes sp. NPDC051346 TaxID=3155048 RepID=UPI003435907B